MMKVKINDLLENYLIQINYFQEKINKFEFVKEDGMSNQKVRDTFLNLALYIDKLNYYQTNYNKLKAIDDFLDTGLVLAEQRHNLEFKLGTIEQETSTLIDFWLSI